MTHFPVSSGPAVDPAAWDSVVPDWSPYVSGWETEYFVKWGTDGEPRFEGDLFHYRRFVKLSFARAPGQNHNGCQARMIQLCSG